MTWIRLQSQCNPLVHTANPPNSSFEPEKSLQMTRSSRRTVQAPGRGTKLRRDVVGTLGNHLDTLDTYMDVQGIGNGSNTPENASEIVRTTQNGWKTSNSPDGGYRKLEAWFAAFAPIFQFHSMTNGFCTTYHEIIVLPKFSLRLAERHRSVALKTNVAGESIWGRQE